LPLNNCMFNHSPPVIETAGGDARFACQLTKVSIASAVVLAARVRGPAHPGGAHAAWRAAAAR
jgi:hypothetical protein